MENEEQNIREPLLQARGIYKRYGRRGVLEGASFSVAPEEIVTLIGPNGSGKTTLLRILLGLEEATRGDVIRHPDLRVGYVPQKLHFSPVIPITVMSFLQMFCPIAAKIKMLAEELNLSRILARQMSMLSGGEMQRVLLAQALLKEPNLLVLDEPVQGVDFSGQARIYQLIKQVCRDRQCAVLMVSHDLHMVMAGTDRVICLNRHICCSGSPKRVSRDPEFTRLFGQEVANQLAFYAHHHDHRHTITGDVVPVEGGEHEGHSHAG